MILVMTVIPVLIFAFVVRIERQRMTDKQFPNAKYFR